MVIYKTYIKFSLLSVIVLCFVSCAQIVAPSGGPKDAVPPKIEKEIPLNKNTSFNTNRITLKFDEYIQLKDVGEQLVISPPMEEKPIIEVSGKTVLIEIRSTLKPNTTYTLNFGNSITDNNENNVLANYSYVFSTGIFIDTLYLKGTILNSFNTKPEKGFLVCLYPTDSFTDSTIYLKKPLYFTKTNEIGLFKIENLPNESFKLIAFKDENKNLKYDQNELISFYDSIVNPIDTIPLNILQSFKPNPYTSNRLLDTLSREQGKFQFAVFKPTNISIKPVDTSQYYTWFKKGKEEIDTFTLFNKNWTLDSVYFTYHTPTFDSIFYVKPRKSAKPGKFEISIKKDIELNDTFLINFNQPLLYAITDTSKLIIKEDTVIINPIISYTTTKEFIKFYYPLKEKNKYSIEVKDSAFIDIYGNYNKKDKASISTKGLKDYSTLLLEVIHPNNSKQYILQIVSEDESKVYKSFIILQNSKLNLEYIIPAKYKIKIIEDRNRNEKWDNGDYMLKNQPEKVFYYKELLTLRAYWDLEQQIDLNKLVD